MKAHAIKRSSVDTPEIDICAPIHAVEVCLVDAVCGFAPALRHVRHLLLATPLAVSLLLVFLITIGVYVSATIIRKLGSDGH